MTKKVELTNLSDHDLLLKMCGHMETIIDDNADFKTRILSLEAEKISKSEVKDILADSAKVKEDLHLRVGNIEQGKTPHQMSVGRILTDHTEKIEDHSKWKNYLVAVCAIATFIQACFMIYIMSNA